MNRSRIILSGSPVKLITNYNIFISIQPVKIDLKKNL